MLIRVCVCVCLQAKGHGHGHSHYPAAERYAAANGDMEEGVTEKLQNGEAGLGAGLALDKVDGGEGDRMLTPDTTPQVRLSHTHTHTHCRSHHTSYTRPLPFIPTPHTHTHTHSTCRPHSLAPLSNHQDAQSLGGGGTSSGGCYWLKGTAYSDIGTLAWMIKIGRAHV